MGLSMYIVCIAGRVEARQPHVANDHELQRVGRVLSPLGDEVAPSLIADVRLPVGRVRRSTGHDHLQRALGVVRTVPIGTELRDGFVERHADAAAHAHDHALAAERRRAILEVADQILCNHAEALLRADQGLDGRPFAFEALLLVGSLVFSERLDLGVEERLLVLVEFDPGQAALVDRSAPSPRPRRRG